MFFDFIILLFLCFVIIAAVSRWIFRINDIVKNLEIINAQLNMLTGLNTKSQVQGPGIELDDNLKAEPSTLKKRFSKDK